MRAAAASPAAADHRADGDRLVLPGIAGLVPGLLYLELDGPRLWEGAFLGPDRIDIWDCADGVLRGLCVGVLLPTAGEAAQWWRGRFGGLQPELAGEPRSQLPGHAGVHGRGAAFAGRRCRGAEQQQPMGRPRRLDCGGRHSRPAWGA